MWLQLQEVYKIFIWLKKPKYTRNQPRVQNIKKIKIQNKNNKSEKSWKNNKIGPNNNFWTCF
jgi:hypothetical protein